MVSLTAFWLVEVRSLDFGVKSRVRKLTYCFLFVEVSAPNDCCAAFVGCFDDEVIPVF